MTQVIPSQTNSLISSFISQEQLMEGIIAEDAAHGEIGCGRDWGNKFSVYLNTCGINVSHEKLMGLLQEYLGSVLMEPDLERIFQLITRFIEPLVVETHIQYRNPQSITQLSLVEKIPEHVPSEKIREILVADLGDYYSHGQLLKTAEVFD